MKTMRMRMIIFMASALVVAGLLLNFVFPGSPNLSLAAADAAIRGVVTDSAGKPMRGAVVKATSGSKAVARFTDKDGRYQIPGLPPGRYEVSAEENGFGVKRQTKDTAQGGDTNFALERKWDVNQLSTADLSAALPQNEEIRFLEAHCVDCHTFSSLVERRGMTARQWEGLIMGMGTSTGLNPARRMTEPQKAHAGRVLEKYFGPDSAEPRPEQVKRVEPSDAALQATFYEFQIPTRGSLPHSIIADNKGNGWFAEYHWRANKFGRLNFETGEITEYPVPMEKSAPHTPIIDKEGKVWMPLAQGNRLSVMDPETGRVNIFPDEVPGAHTVEVDQKKNI